jgi:hypothetical protein
VSSTPPKGARVQMGSLTGAVMVSRRSSALVWVLWDSTSLKHNGSTDATLWRTEHRDNLTRLP